MPVAQRREGQVAQEPLPLCGGDDFAAWVAPHLAVLAALAVREVGAADAEDVVQEALLRAWRRRSTYRAELGSPRAWLVAVLLDRARRHRVRRRSGHRQVREVVQRDHLALAGRQAGHRPVEVERVVRRPGSRGERVAVEPVGARWRRCSASRPAR